MRENTVSGRSGKARGRKYGKQRINRRGIKVVCVYKIQQVLLYKAVKLDREIKRYREVKLCRDAIWS